MVPYEGSCFGNALDLSDLLPISVDIDDVFPNIEFVHSYASLSRNHGEVDCAGRYIMPSCQQLNRGVFFSREDSPEGIPDYATPASQRII